MELKGETALVTGASGFVGGYVARRLAETEGMRVRALIRNPNGGTVVSLGHPGIELVAGNLLDRESLEQACTDVKIVVHSALSWTRNAPLFRSTIVDGTRNVYEAARNAGALQFIYMSSVSVYYGALGRSRCSSGIDHEETPLSFCGDPYADSKIAAERLILHPTLGGHMKGPRVTSLRAAATYGPGSRIWVEKLVEDAKRDRLYLPGGGRFPLPYVYIDNLVDAVVAAARIEASSGAYDILDGHTTYREYVEPFARLSGSSPRYLPMWFVRLATTAVDVYSRMRGGSRRNTYASSAVVQSMNAGQRHRATADKARRDLGWSPRVDMAEGMRRTELWLREEGYIN